MPTFSDTPLPKMLGGSLHEQWVRCGKKNCRCARGEQHGPYLYYFTRCDDRTYKTYIPPSALPAVRAALAEWQKFQDLLDFYNRHGWGRCTSEHATYITRVINAPP